MDTNNPAVKKHLDLPPAMLEALVEDPHAAAPIFRSAATIMIMEDWAERANLTQPQRLALQERLARLGHMDAKPEQTGGGTGGGYQLVINFNGAKPDEFHGLTIDQKAIAEGLE